MTDRPRDESPWYCANCRSWIGWKLDTCPTCDKYQPRFPLRYDDVPFDYSLKVTIRHRVLGACRSLMGAICEVVR